MTPRVALPPELEQYRAAVYDLVNRYRRLVSPTFNEEDIASAVVGGFQTGLASYKPVRSLLSWLYLNANARVYWEYCKMAGPVSTRPTRKTDSPSARRKIHLALVRKSLDVPLRGTDDITLKDLLTDGQPPVWEVVHESLDPGAELRALLTKYVFESERPLLFTIFGIAPYRRKSEAELAAEAGVSRQWINYKLQKTIKRLRQVPALRAELQTTLLPRRGGKQVERVVVAKQREVQPVINRRTAGAY